MFLTIKTKLKSILFKFFDKIQCYIRLYELDINDVRVNVHSSTYGCKKDTFRLFCRDDYIEIGKFCSVADKVTIIASGEHHIENVSTYPFYDRHYKTTTHRDTSTKGNVIVANDVWIGFSSTILSGVKIGNGAVIAAGSVVVGDVPDYAIVAGVPARVVKYRFTQAIIDSLLKIKWWDWSAEVIHTHREDFYLPVDEFITKHLKKEESNDI
jgi:acetyltransferase-like isoleucine patch superfamily enzyme